MNFKKNIYLFAIIFLNLDFYTSQAQNFHLGVQGNFALCFQNGKTDSLEKQDFSVLPSVGIYFREKLSEHWFLQQEINYASRGVKYSMESNSQVDDTTALKTLENGARTVSYLDVPFLLGYQNHRFSLAVGAQASYLLAARLQRNFTFTYTYPHAAQEIIRSSDENKKTAAYAPFQYGLLGEVSYEVRPKFSLTARYYYGISNLYKDAAQVHQQAMMLGARFQIL